MKRFVPKPAQIAGGLVWIVAVMIGYQLFYYVTPQLEAQFFPVITDQSITNVRRDNEKVCWTWRWVKRRYAYPKTVVWNLVVDGTAVAQTLIVTRQRDGSIVRDLKGSALGPGSTDLCAPIPVDFTDLQTLTIRGAIGTRCRTGCGRCGGRSRRSRCRPSSNLATRCPKPPRGAALHGRFLPRLAPAGFRWRGLFLLIVPRRL
jgi:hypothetical protein